MKVLKVVLICICIISLLLPFTVIFIGNNMQSYYKGFIDNPSKSDDEIRDALVKKRVWAQICESPNWIYSFIIFGASVISLIVLLMIKKYGNFIF